MRHALVCVLLAGCSPSDADLFVDLRTDLSPEAELFQVDVEATRAGEAPRAQSTRVSATDDYASGVRVAELTGLRRGDWTVAARLLGASREILATRTVLVRLRETLAITIVLSRECAGRVCPQPGDDPSFTSCSCGGGRCAPPGVFLDEREDCADRECEVAADCPDGTACVATSCIDGTCFHAPRVGGCPAGSFCDPDRGCVERPDAGRGDSGPEADGGHSDAGPSDCAEGTADCNGSAADGCETPLGTTADCRRCGERCGPNEGCVARGCFCGAGFLDCDPVADGCESRADDPATCGACDNPCDAGESCSDGECLCAGVRCSMARTCCGGACVPLDRDEAHCGACGVACDPGETCVAGVCLCGGVECNSVRLCCGGECTRVRLSEMHCGMCDNPCSPGESCADGVCTPTAP